jgi:thiosulfate/3-mercaptopyruvate sulfurtransferase
MNRHDSLVSPEWLEERLGDPDVRVVEVDVSDAAYNEGHIPGSVLWNIYRDLKDSEYRLRDVSALRDLMEASGIAPSMTVVFYGYAPALGFWLLKLLRHPDARILDATRASWLEASRPWVTDQPTTDRATYPLPETDPHLRAGRAAVERAIDDPRQLILDVRTEAEYRGERFWPSGAPEEHGRAGHVPSAVNVPADLLYDTDGRFRQLHDLRDVVAQAGVGPQVTVIPYCTIGARAAATWFVLTHLLDHDHVTVYDGSWAEWGHCADTPVAVPTLSSPATE